MKRLSRDVLRDAAKVLGVPVPDVLKSVKKMKYECSELDKKIRTLK